LVRRAAIVVLLPVDACEQVTAGLLAGAAGVGADPAVLVDAGVAGAFVTAGLTRRGAGLEQRPPDASKVT
jgi:hypothetical protein